MASAWGNRPALDGIRTLAVYLVVLFHAGVATFEGGFLGVDLFFVLSGLLVTSILLQELETTGRLMLLRFYARRIRRLLPAAIVVVVAVSAVFVLLASSVARAPWVGDGQSALLYVSNWRFLSQSGDYFAADFDSSPFLHFWSLSIEEQFYFVFPLALLGLVALGRWWRHAVPAGLLVLASVSIASQLFWAAQDETNRAYYGTDARLYQLLAGALLAWWWRRNRMNAEASDATTTAPVRRPVGLTTVLLVAFVVVSSSVLSVSASVRGLLATVVAVALLFAVLSERDRLAHRLLTLRPITYLGRISYGTYLWHWPVALVLGVVFEASPWVVAALTIGVSTGLAALSAEVIEHPLRYSKELSRINRTTVAGGLALSVVVALAVVPPLLNSDGRPALAAGGSGVTVATDANSDRPVPQDINWQAVADNLGRGGSCTGDDTTSCVVHEGASGPTVALVGDSHARSIAPAMIKLAEEHDFTLVLSVVGGCSWQRGVTSQESIEGGETACKQARDTLYDGLITELDVDVTLLVQTPRDWGRWTEDLGDADGDTADIDQLNLTTMTDTVERIRGMGSAVVLMDSWIRPDFAGVDDPLACLAGAEMVSECRVPAPEESHLSDAIYQNLALTVPDIATVNINDLMCSAWPVCEPMVGRTPVWRDEGHYSTGALLEQRAGIWDRLVATGYFGAS